MEPSAGSCPEGLSPGESAALFLPLMSALRTVRTRRWSVRVSIVFGVVVRKFRIRGPAGSTSAAGADRPSPKPGWGANGSNELPI